MQRTIALLTLALLGCTASSTTYTESRPAELVGRWVLLRSDGTWSDTTTWHPDGSMSGSTGHPVPADARWAVRTSRDGARAICIGGGGQANCQPYVVAGDTLVWGVGADADRFRRLGDGQRR